MAQALSFAGAAFVLGAFAALQLGRMRPQQTVYQAMNLVGAAMLGVSAVMMQTWGFVLLNAVWGAFSIYKLAEGAFGRGPASSAADRRTAHATGEPADERIDEERERPAGAYSHS